MQVIKLALGFLLLILGVVLTATPFLAIPLGLSWMDATALWVLALFLFDLGLEWRFARGMAPWWRKFPATDKQKEKARQLGIKYSECTSRREMSDLIFKADSLGHGPSGASANAHIRKVYSAANTQEARWVKTELEQQGIDALILSDPQTNAVEDLPAVAIAPEVWVFTEKANAARSFLASRLSDLKEAETAAPKWECNECGESNEPTFELCWNCLAAHE